MKTESSACLNNYSDLSKRGKENKPQKGWDFFAGPQAEIRHGPKVFVEQLTRIQSSDFHGWAEF